MATEKVVITGGSGFIGRHLTKLLAERAFKVISIDIATCPNPIENVDYVKEDINDLADQEIHQILKDSTLIHLAAVSSSQMCEGNLKLTLDVNVNLTSRLVQIANSAGVKVIFASSEWVYPEASEAVELFEDFQIELTTRTNIYAMSKIVAEWYLRRYCLNYQILRFGIVYGERSTPQSAIEKIVFDAVNKSKIEVGNFHTARRFIHVLDVCSGILQCLSEKSEAKVFNLSGIELISLEKILEDAESILGYNLNVESLNQISSIRNPVPYLFSSEFNWSPEIPTREGIARLLEFYKLSNERK